MYEFNVVMKNGENEVFYARGPRFQDLEKRIGAEMAARIAYVDFVVYVD